MNIVSYALRTLHELMSYYPILLPTLFIFSRESASSVKLWQAVQRIPHPNPLSENGDGESVLLQKESAPEGIPKWIQMFVVLIILTVALYVGALLVVPGWILEGELKIKIFYTCTLSIPVSAIVVSTVASRNDATVLYRDADGKLAKMVCRDRSAPSTTVSALLGVSITVGALWFGYPLAVLLVYAALLHNMVHPGICTDKVKFKSISIFAIILGVPMLLLAIEVVAVILYRRRNNIPTGGGALCSFVARGDPLVDWKNILIYTCCSFLQFQVLAVAYRFDYANSLPSDFQPLVGRKTNIGYRIPRLRYFSIGEVFPRPYFSAALTALITSYIVVAALSTADFIAVTYETAPIASMTFSLVWMVSSMLALAAMKGQSGKLWRYEEDWTAISSPNEAEVHEADIAEEEEQKVEEVDSLLYDLDDVEVRGAENV